MQAFTDKIGRQQKGEETGRQKKKETGGRMDVEKKGTGMPSVAGRHQSRTY